MDRWMKELPLQCMKGSRSLVRRLTDRLPLPATQRIHLHSQNNGDYRQLVRENSVSTLGSDGYTSSGCDLETALATAWQGRLLMTLNDLPSMMTGAAAKSDILLRCQMFGDRPTPDGAVNSSSLMNVEPSSHPSRRCACSCGSSLTRSATASCSGDLRAQGVSSMVSELSLCSEEVCAASPVDHRSRMKISELEEEVEKLRHQLAFFVMAQEQAASSSRDPFEVPSTPSSTLIRAPLPPPPPPPPPLLILDNSRSVIDAIREKRNAKKGVVSGIQAGQPNMTEVLKDIGAVKLKRTLKSPGGTPLKRRALERDDGTDPSALIARALKRKFANCAPFRSPDSPVAPEGSQQGQGSSGWSPQNTPPSPPPKRILFGPHLLKSSRQRATQSRHPRTPPLPVVAE